MRVSPQKKLVPPNIFLIKKEDTSSLNINRGDFFALLMMTLKKTPEICRLNFPETLIKLSGLTETYLLHTDKSSLVYSENLSQHTINKFYRRCAYHKNANFPLCVAKIINETSEDVCMVCHTVSDCEMYWEINNSIIVQRFVIPGVEAIFKSRISYNVDKEEFISKLIWKNADGTFKLGKHDSVVEEDMSINDSLKDQMISLKEILQQEYVKLEIVEIIADFIQDSDGEWYFINFIYAIGQVIKKKPKIPQKTEKKAVRISEPVAKTPEVSFKDEALKEIFSILLEPDIVPKTKKHKKK